MKIIKRILIVLAVLILLIAAVGLIFFPGKINVEKSIVINKSQPAVYKYVSDLKNWNSWSPWYELDPNARYEFVNGSTGKGAMLKWDSPVKNVGKGTMTIAELKPDSAVILDLNFMDQGTAQGYYHLSPEGNGTKFSWGINVDAGANPLMRIMGAFFDDMMGKDFEKGLNKLKANVELMQEPADYKVEEVKIPVSNYLFVKDHANYQTIGEHLGKSYGAIGQAMAKQKLQQSGAPFAIYYTSSDTAWDFDAGIPVNKKGKDDGIVKAGELKNGNAVVVHYFGPYMGTGKAHTIAHEYIGKNNKKITGAPWEIYVTDPGTEKDTMKWQTDVYYPVE